MLKFSFLAVSLFLVAGPVLAEEMNNLKLDDIEQIEMEQAKAMAPADAPAAGAPAEPAPAAAPATNQ